LESATSTLFCKNTRVGGCSRTLIESRTAASLARAGSRNR
jgi:hypothetical protein